LLRSCYTKFLQSIRKSKQECLVKKVTLSLVAVSMLATTGSFAADDLASAFKEGKASGQIRAFYITRDYDKRNETATTKDRAAVALGGKLGYETASLYGVSAGAMFYTTNGLGMKNKDTYKIDPTLFGQAAAGTTDKPDVTYLGQAYLQGTFGKTTVKAGRQELNTPLAGMDDARMLPNLFEAAVVINKNVPDTTLIGAVVTRMASGTFANGYADNALALQSGYGWGDKTGEFRTMSKVALGAGVDNRSVYVAAAINNSIKNLTLQVWDYYADDILNAIYAQADYKFNVGVDAVASYQFWNENGIGDQMIKKAGLGSVKGTLNAVKLAVTPVKGANVYGAISKTEQQKGVGATLNGGMITPWGGSPGFVQGTVTRLAYTAGATAWKAGASYDIIPGLNAHVSYAQFNTSPQASYGNTVRHNAGETDFDITYKPAAVKNLELKLRGIYARDFVPAQDFNEYRLIANYNF
jgi:imipenem/basic amino acid-specific outer membrane pore